MKPSRSVLVSGTSALIALLTAAGCNDSKGYDEPANLTIVGVAGAQDDVVKCSPAKSGGACMFGVVVTFRMPEGEFVSKAYVRFAGDGSDTGTDRSYLVVDESPDGRQPYGRGPELDQTARFEVLVPPVLIRDNAQLTYSVRLVTGNGAESPASTLRVTIQPEEDDATAE